MMKTTVSIAVVVSLFLSVLAACDRVPASNAAFNDAETKALSKRIADLEQKVRMQDIDASILKDRVAYLESDSAKINSTEKIYSVARNQFGAFPMVYRSASSYLDGHKVLVDVGNPTQILFSGAELTIEYGPPEPKKPDGSIDWDRYSEYRSLRKTQKTKVMNQFRPAWYTTVEVTLPATKPEEVRELAVGIFFDEIMLARPN